MHVASLVDLCHGRIHQRVAGLALAPGLKQHLCVRAALPLNGIVFGLEGAVCHMGKVGQNRKVKITPHQLTQPHRCTLATRGLALQGDAHQLANRHRAKTQVHAQITGAFDGRKIARGVVVVHALKKRFKQGLSTQCAGGDFQAGQVGGFKPDVGQTGHRLLVSGGSLS